MIALSTMNAACKQEQIERVVGPNVAVQIKGGHGQVRVRAQILQGQFSTKKSGTNL